MLEHAARVKLAGGGSAAGVFEFGDVVHGHQHAVPRLIVVRQDNALEQDVEAAAVKRVVDAAAFEPRLARPELDEFAHVRFKHVVAQHVSQARGEGFRIRGGVHGQRAPVHAQHLDTGRTRRHARYVLFQKALQVGYAGGAPLGKEAVQIAVVLQPQ